MKKILLLLFIIILAFTGCRQPGKDPPVNAGKDDKPAGTVQENLPAGTPEKQPSAVSQSDDYAKTCVAPLVNSGIAWESWESPEKIDLPPLFTFAFYQIFADQPKINDTSYFSYIDQKYCFPAEMVETALLKHFNLKESYLHSLNAYDPVKNAYLFPGLVGGGSFQVDKVTKDSKLVTIDFHYDDDISKETLKKVTLVAEEVPEGFKYLSCKTKTVYPLLADLEKTSKTTEPKIVPSASSGWSYTDRPKVYRFNRGRDISGLEFKFTVVLNGKYKIGYPNIPLYVGINHFINRNGY